MAISVLPTSFFVKIGQVPRAYIYLRPLTFLTLPCFPAYHNAFVVRRCVVKQAFTLRFCRNSSRVWSGNNKDVAKRTYCLRVNKTRFVAEENAQRRVGGDQEGYTTLPQRGGA